MRTAFLNAAAQLAQSNPDVILMTGDLGAGASADFVQGFPPARLINAGISEQNMVSVAAGLALSGKVVFVYAIANFAALRCLEHLRNNAAYHGADVKVAAAGAGAGYGAMGATHHATEDLSILRAMPGVTVFSPSDGEEARLAAFAAAETPGCCYIRLSKAEDLTVLSPEAEPAKDIFRARKIRGGGGEICVFATGAAADQALEAAKAFGAPLYSFAAVKPIDRAFICRAARMYKTILTFEENQVQGGFGGAVSEIVAALPGDRARVCRIGFEDTFVHRTGSREWILAQYGVSAARAAEMMRAAAEES